MSVCIPAFNGAQSNHTDAQLFKTLPTFLQDVEVGEITDWKWNGPTERFAAVAE